MIFWSKKFSRWRFFRWLDLGRLENLATKNRENISKLSNQKKFKGVFFSSWMIFGFLCHNKKIEICWKWQIWIPSKDTFCARPSRNGTTDDIGEVRKTGNISSRAGTGLIFVSFGWRVSMGFRGFRFRAWVELAPEKTLVLGLQFKMPSMYK